MCFISNLKILQKADGLKKGHTLFSSRTKACFYEVLYAKGSHLNTITRFNNAGFLEYFILILRFD